MTFLITLLLLLFVVLGVHTNANDVTAAFERHLRLSENVEPAAEERGPCRLLPRRFPG